MAYFDFFVLPVPTANKPAYLAHAKRVADIFKELGALSVTEMWGDDVPAGEVNSFRTAVLLEENETVVCGWIAWPDKPTRMAAWEKAMADPRMIAEGQSMPYDGKRMIFGAFEEALKVE